MLTYYTKEEVKDNLHKDGNFLKGKVIRLRTTQGPGFEVASFVYYSSVPEKFEIHPIKDGIINFDKAVSAYGGDIMSNQTYEVVKEPLHIVLGYLKNLKTQTTPPTPEVPKPVSFPKIEKGDYILIKTVDISGKADYDERLWNSKKLPFMGKVVKVTASTTTFSKDVYYKGPNIFNIEGTNIIYYSANVETVLGKDYNPNPELDPVTGEPIGNTQFAVSKITYTVETHPYMRVVRENYGYKIGDLVAINSYTGSDLATIKDKNYNAMWIPPYSNPEAIPITKKEYDALSKIPNTTPWYEINAENPTMHLKKLELEDKVQETKNEEKLEFKQIKKFNL